MGWLEIGREKASDFGRNYQKCQVQHAFCFKHTAAPAVDAVFDLSGTYAHTSRFSFIYQLCQSVDLPQNGHYSPSRSFDPEFTYRFDIQCYACGGFSPPPLTLAPVLPIFTPSLELDITGFDRAMNDRIMSG